MDSKQPPEGGRNPHIPSGGYAKKQQALPVYGHRPKNRSFFQAEKLTDFDPGEHPLPPSIFMKTDHFLDAYTRQKKPYHHEIFCAGMTAERIKNMGANRERKHKITLYLSDNEYTMLIAKTKITRMRSMSQTLRCLLISADLYDIDLRYVLDHNTLLAKIGNNLNQIAKYVNTSQEVTMEQYQEVRDIMKQILDLQLRFLKALPPPLQADLTKFNSKPLLKKKDESSPPAIKK